MTQTAPPLSESLGAYRLADLPQEPDRLVFWPSALAIAFVTARFVMCVTTGLRDQNAWLFLLVWFTLPILLCGTFVLFVLWIGSSVKYLFSGRWRRLISSCIAPAAIILALMPIVTQHDPLHRFIYSRALERKAAKTSLPFGKRFAALNISEGLFVPPLTLLIYDETDEIGRARNQQSDPIQTRGSASDQSIMLACSGESEYVVAHYYICNPEREPILPPP